MTSGTEREDARTEEQTQSVDRIRRDLAEGFAAVRARENMLGISTMSLAEMIARDIRGITESQSEIRPSKLDEVEQVRQKVVASVDQALELPGSVFEITEEQAVANTDEEGEGPNSLETEDG
jgi:hypothetical protein